MHDIFLSYASENRARASQLAAALEKQGWEVWWDRTILPGKTFDRVIESELNAATCVIVLWSKISVESQWVRAEAGDALNKGRLIPALLEDTEIPLVFRQIQAASLLDWAGDPGHEGFKQLTLAITAFVAPALPRDTNLAIGDTTGTPETPEPETPDRQPDTVHASGQAPTQAKSGNRLTALLWPATTLIALLIASLAGYLYWQKPGNPETPVVAEIRVDPASQGVSSVPSDKIRTAAEATLAGNPEAEQASRQDAGTVPAGSVNTTPHEPVLARTTAPAHDIRPPQPSQPARAEPKVPAPAPIPVAAQKPVREHKPPTRHRPAVPQAEATASSKAKTTPPPPAVATPAPAPLKTLIVVWGTPNDDGLSSDSKTRKYSNSLAQLMTSIIKTSIQRPIVFDYHYIENRDHHSLMRDKPEFNKSAAMCRERNLDLLLFGFMEGSEFDMTIGYVPSREPFFQVFDCKSGKGTAKRFRVTDSRDESFPYEKGLIRAFRSFTQQEIITDLNAAANRASVD